MEKINAVVIDLNSMDMFLEYNWLFKYNPKLNWDKKTIWFTRYPKEYKTQHQNTMFTSRTRRMKPMKKCIYIFIQQEEIWEATGKKRMEPWNQSTERCTKGVKC